MMLTGPPHLAEEEKMNERCPHCNQPYAHLEWVEVADCTLFRTADGEYRTSVAPLIEERTIQVGHVCLTCCPPLSSQEAHWWQDRLGHRLT